MTEIKLTLEDPAEFARWLRAHAGQMPSTWSARADQLDAISHQIDLQMKPAVEEPTEFGSVISACLYGERMLWQRSPMHGKHYWESEKGVVDVWSELTDVEVLRVGVATTPERAQSWRWGYEQATKNTRDRIGSHLTALRSTLITASEQSAIDKALAEIEKDADDTVTGRGFPS